MTDAPVGGLARFLAHHKKYWLLPLAIVAVLVSALILYTRSADLAPFAYSAY